jgi:hypothetical protein
MSSRQLPEYLPKDWPEYAEVPTLSEWERALEEDRIAARAFKKMELDNEPPTSTARSIAEGDAAMAEAYMRSAAEVARMVETRELLSTADFCSSVGVTRSWLEEALKDGCVSAIVCPGGRSYYPAFYAAEGINRADLQRVFKLLAHLPALSQYRFFTTVRTSLAATPLTALQASRSDAVLKAAECLAADWQPRTPSIVEQFESPGLPQRHDPRDSFTDVLNGVKPS